MKNTEAVSTFKTASFFCIPLQRRGRREERSDEAICFQVQFASAIPSDFTQCVFLSLPRKDPRTFCRVGHREERSDLLPFIASQRPTLFGSSHGAQRRSDPP